MRNNDNQILELHSQFGGFFAELYKVIYNIILISFYEPAGDRIIDVKWTEEFFPYKDNKSGNGWDLFFYPIGNVKKNGNINNTSIIHDQNCLSKWYKYDEFYDYRLGINKLIDKYIKIKEEILNEVNDFYNYNMNNFECIGVHVRFATSHINEKPRLITLDEYFNEIDATIKTLQSNYKIFLATDSEYVVRQFKKKYEKLLYTNAIRSNYMEEVHLIYDAYDYWISHSEEFHKKKPGYKGGKDVLMDCLLLSKCNVLIHSTSNVSDFATFFNPEIKSIFLPKDITINRQCSACSEKNKWYNKIK